MKPSSLEQQKQLALEMLTLSANQLYELSDLMNDASPNWRFLKGETNYPAVQFLDKLNSWSFITR
jgi:hypothetical protein